MNSDPLSDASELLPVVGVRLRPILARLRAYAATSDTILLSGPTGAGKSRLAHWIHTVSGRCNAPFVTVDLLSVPETMQQAELFGWRRGAFTGADTDQEGCVARAAGGTLFLDEVDKLSLAAQASLLHLLENQRFRVLGDPGRERSSQARVLAGTNVDLKRAMEAGRFREDLYYRLHVLPVHLPSLRERPDELPAWARYMAIRRHHESGSRRALELSAQAVLELSAFDWPGNLRQLNNVIRRAYVHAFLARNTGPVLLDAKHVSEALEPERGRKTKSVLFDLLLETADAFVVEAERFALRGEVLPLEGARALRGLILERARVRSGDLNKVYELFGWVAAINNRNQRRILRRELAHVERLRSTLGATLSVNP